MKATIYVDGILIERFEKIGRCTIAFLADGRQVNSTKIGVVECKCVKCEKIQSLRYRKALRDKPYICQTCNRLGENNAFFGHSHTDAFKEKLSKDRRGTRTGISNPFYGKQHSEKTKAALRVKCALHGEKNGFFGKSHTKETRQKMSDFRKKNPRPKEYYSKLGVMSANKHPRKTRIEKLVQQKLKSLDIVHRYNFILKRVAQYDFLIDDNIILEVHGDYWHGNPAIYASLNERQHYKKERDVEKEKLAKANGYQYYVIWENDVKTGNWSIINEIQAIRNQVITNNSL